jgi:hypothetical protein
MPLVSYGNDNMQAAVTKKHAAEAYNGRETSMVRRTPVRMGATIPAARLSADAIPHAVPRTRPSKTSGVYLQRARQRTINDRRGRTHPYITA